MPGAIERAGSSAERRKLRATQTIVSHMSFCWRHPSLTAIEIGWRWLFGVPFLLVAWAEMQKVLAKLPPEAAGLDRVEFQNPWLSSVLLAEAAGRYAPLVAGVLHWLLPVAVVAWAVVSGVGRTLVLTRMNTLDPFGGRAVVDTFWRRLPAVIGFQGLWMVALVGCLWGWYRAVGWASATYITAGAQPDLIGYLCWLIFFSLGIYTLWALVSWTLAVGPVLFFAEGNALRSLRRGFSLGKVLSGKLVEVSLVLAIVKIMLIVLDMVFSAAPLPFADQFGPDALHVLYVVVAVVFLVANDYFYVVRLRSFVALWRHYRGGGS